MSNPSLVQEKQKLYSTSMNKMTIQETVDQKTCATYAIFLPDKNKNNTKYLQESIYYFTYHNIKRCKRTSIFSYIAQNEKEIKTKCHYHFQ